MKKIWLFCLCLASLSLVGCFHVPDEDWLPSKNNAKTEDLKKNVEKDEDVEQAINSLVQWIDKISSDWNGLENGENDGKITENVDVEALEENTDNEEITANEAENEEIEGNNSSEWGI